MIVSHKNDGRTEHAYVTERLSAYLDGQLTSKEGAAVERHLAGCRHCQWNLRTLRQTVQWTRELPKVAVPRAFAVPVPVRPARQVRWRWTAPLLQGATALVAVLFFIAVAGSTYVTRLTPGAAPAPESTAVLEKEVAPAPTQVAVLEVEMQPVEVQVEVQKEVAAPAEAAVSETVVAEAPAPAALPENEVALAPSTDAPEAAPSDADTIRAMEKPMTTVAGQVTEEGERAEAEPPAAEPLAAGVDSEPTSPPPVPTDSAEPRSAVEPTLVAAAGGLAQPDEADARVALREPAASWLGAAVMGLGIAFVILGTLTALVLFRRLRTT